MESGDYFLMLDLTFMISGQELDASKLHVLINNWNGPDKKSTNSEELVFTNHRKFTPGMWVLHTVDRDNLIILVSHAPQNIFPGDQYEITIITSDGKSFVTKGTVTGRTNYRDLQTHHPGDDVANPGSFDITCDIDHEWVPRQLVIIGNIVLFPYSTPPPRPMPLRS